MDQAEQLRLRAEMIRLSGGGKRHSANRKYGLYSSVNLPVFDGLAYVRDTAERFKEFGIADEVGLKGLGVLDIGSNVGAVSFEALRCGAKYVAGYEFNAERVGLCNDIAMAYKLKAMFYQWNFNDSYPPVKADVVFCTSVDEYLDDVQQLYDNLYRMTGKVLYHECNVQGGQDVEETGEMFRKAGFQMVAYLGKGHAGVCARKRKIYRCVP